MTHEILIAESRKELEWLSRENEFREMLFDYAIQNYPICLSILKEIENGKWLFANVDLRLLYQNLIKCGIIRLSVPAAQVGETRNFIGSTICSTIQCMSNIRSVMVDWSNGKKASIDISKLIDKKKTFLDRLFDSKQNVYIIGNLVIPPFPAKFLPIDKAKENIYSYACDFVSQVGYYTYATQKAKLGCTKNVNVIFQKPSNSNINRIPVGLDGKISQYFTGIRFGHNAGISFHRTLRVPETGQKHQLPADLGALPIHRIEDYADKVPAHWLEDGGLFIPLYQKEALFIQMEGNTWHPSIAKVCVGRINAVSGDPFNENLNGHKQDYVLIPHQKWLDGINMGNGIVRQFVAMPLGQGYTVEAQITDEETFGGFQLVLYPPKEGRFPERNPAIDSRIKIPEPTKVAKQDEQTEAPEISLAHKPPLAPDQGKQKPQIETTKIDQTKPATAPQALVHEKPTSGSESASLFAPPAQPSMGIAAGGKIQQQIYPDIFGSSTWDADCRRVISIRLVNSITYKTITGFDPPPSPITPDLYQKSGYPWFSYFDENLGSAQGSKILSKVQTIGEIERRRGMATPNTAPQPMRATPPRIIRTPEISGLLNELRYQAKNHLESMNLKECLRSITMVLSLENRASANDYVIRSNCNSQLGYAKEGFIDACLALEIDPNCIDALASRASCRLLLGDYEGAEEDARVLTSIPTTEPIGLAIQAELLVLNNRFQDAVYAALRALKMYPDNKKLKDILEKARVESVRHAKKISP